MKFVFRHFNILSRPSSIDGHEWEEVHDPEIMIDLKVGASCLLFLIVAGIMMLVGDTFGSLFYIFMTAISTLADAVFYNHYYLDLFDRFTAMLGAFYMVYFSTLWFWTLEEYFDLIVWIKLGLQVGSAVTPFRFLEQCRQYPVRSENWRDNHVKWHVTGTIAMVLSIMISQGMLDPVLDSILLMDPGLESIRESL